MAGFRIPGPLGTATNTSLIDAGTLARVASPLAGPLGHSAATNTPAASDTPSSNDAALASDTTAKTGAQVNDTEIEALDLAETARTAAYALKKAHPLVKFTSGRRNKNDQARAMAGNVVKNRKWIEQTYAKSSLRKKCQDWVDENPKKTTQTEIAAGFLTILNGATDAELGKFSKHLSGMAFDVQPVTQDAEKIKTTIRGLSGLDKFLDKEGGLIRWHAQFK